ncbi:MAG: class I SAM-dependent methyltransferase [Ignavibacteria bacterium]|nr:class I SAM-dependent methyltransferase [Ignavibacteria bacterium]
MNINEITICPNCQGELILEQNKFRCKNCNSIYEVSSNIPVLISHNNSLNSQKELAKYFDSKYANDEDPWDYESSAAEKMKYEFVVNLIKSMKANTGLILDVGCSFGYLSNKFSVVSKNVIGLDVSLHALMKANEKYKKENITFISASADSIPLKENLADVVILCDGLNGMDLTGTVRDNAVKESKRVLKDNGFTIFTDYLKPEQFDTYIEYIKQHSYEIKNVYYLNDRLWYKLKYGLHAMRKTLVFKKFLSSIAIGKLLSKISSLFGKSGSNHICILAVKK